ncbi:hypothetical protein QJS04_geneDACA008386 [Acorus gramineus]|uniref:Uncharacterized protein n=1 Tax=Acorus gramineus TaxID=55184 RepID=A0AAV9AGI3_ACOGR|nr:hypothetical protein QJS04_geneDACA008386 [Acorus gramineus]
MHGFVWLDRHVDPTTPSDLRLLPPLRVSSDTSHFPYSHPTGHRSAIRISRIVSETLRSKAFEGRDVRWLVMGDDDTVFVAENLVRVLNKYDHNGFYYVGSHSESHVQNVEFSFNMAFGGGGFAVSYPLAVELEKMQDRCIKRYPYLYGSDDRMHACMAELGVTLTREPGFHQMDIHGDPFGLLAAHPLAPLVSLHHLDVIDPIFPKMSRVDAINHLFRPSKLDPSALAQQSICYVGNKWTVSVSWGYAVQVMHGVVPPREMERAPRTFKNWRMSMSEKWDFAFDTRASSGNACENPPVYYMSTARREGNGTVTEYMRRYHRVRKCRRRMAAGGLKSIERVVVYKEIEPPLEGTKSPRRNACRAIIKKRIMKVYVGPFMDGEVIEGDTIWGGSNCLTA